MNFSLEEMVVGVIFGSFLIVIMTSVVSRLFHRKEELRMLRTKNVCRICGHVFAEAGAGQITHCPSCDALNFGRRNDSLG